jgi:hypothetical protein
LLVIISHETRYGSVVIGGKTKSRPVEYLTSAEIKMACSNLPLHSYLTIVNTCCYSGSWVGIATSGLAIGKRLVHAATGNSRADNFKTLSGRYRGGSCVTALLECLKRNLDATLSEFVAEMSQEVKAYCHPSTIPIPPQVGISHSAFWQRKGDAFIPIHPDSILPPTVSFTLEDNQATRLDDLFRAISARKREYATGIFDVYS